jgi:hypothetical protein
MVTTVRHPIRFMAIESPMEVVVFPSPRGVGVIPVTSTYREDERFFEPAEISDDGEGR